ncbi:hypothetical protein PHMEG_00017113 [Phytophthora megakarya]|uniref:Uncharacterized protein n=1 Tax=Phytophthora megakarya TaxID=4795 RepID=A0A225VX30_9STRA|nr:hypothetical protein PHMEG_00017113 [Phytophthora megakarya]
MKVQMTEYLSDNRERYPHFTLVADFWTCKTTHYNEREGGIQKPFRMCLTSTLADFGLKHQHFTGRLVTQVET